MQAAIDSLTHLPIEWFVLIGTFFEELISPIPAFVILVPAGASLSGQGVSAWYILVLAVLSGLGRAPAALILYWLARKLGVHLFSRRQSWLGIAKSDLERLRRRLSGRRSWWILFAMWATPVFPGATLSVSCGFIKFPKRAFLTATLLGSIINAIIFLTIGYLGLRAVAILPAFELAGGILSVLILIIILIWLLRGDRIRAKQA